MARKLSLKYINNCCLYDQLNYYKYKSYTVTNNNRFNVHTTIIIVFIK